jgi:hypothetical protein
MTGDPLPDSELLEGLPDRPELMGVDTTHQALLALTKAGIGSVEITGSSRPASRLEHLRTPE